MTIRPLLGVLVIIIAAALCSFIPSEIVSTVVNADPTALAMAAVVPAIRRPPIVVYSLAQWCEMRGISIATARRLNAAGKLKFTQLSERRKGIRSDHDQEYLDACAQDA